MKLISSTKQMILSRERVKFTNLRPEIDGIIDIETTEREIAVLSRALVQCRLASLRNVKSSRSVA